MTQSVFIAPKTGNLYQHYVEFIISWSNHHEKCVAVLIFDS